LPEWERVALFNQALDAIRTIGYEGTRARVLAALAPHLPAELLQQALDATHTIGNGGNRAHALVALTPRLAALPLRDLETMWTQTLRVLAARTRPRLIADFVRLIPVLASLAGQNTPTELSEIARAIQDVARWWP
jgi:hypothetical protein